MNLIILQSKIFLLLLRYSFYRVSSWTMNARNAEMKNTLVGYSYFSKPQVFWECLVIVRLKISTTITNWFRYSVNQTRLRVRDDRVSTYLWPIAIYRGPLQSARLNSPRVHFCTLELNNSRLRHPARYISGLSTNSRHDSYIIQSTLLSSYRREAKFHKTLIKTNYRYIIYIKTTAN